MPCATTWTPARSSACPVGWWKTCTGWDATPSGGGRPAAAAHRVRAAQRRRTDYHRGEAHPAQAVTKGHRHPAGLPECPGCPAGQPRSGIIAGHPGQRPGQRQVHPQLHARQRGGVKKSCSRPTPCALSTTCTTNSTDWRPPWRRPCIGTEEALDPSSPGWSRCRA